MPVAAVATGGAVCANKGAPKMCSNSGGKAAWIGNRSVSNRWARAAGVASPPARRRSPSMETTCGASVLTSSADAAGFTPDNTAAVCVT